MEFSCSDYKTADLQILIHHIYEYKKGIRDLVLHTMNTADRLKAENLLKKRGLHYFIQEVSPKKINIFFGRESSVQIIRSFGDISLSKYTDEQDFILGVMLGYDRKQQCDRYVKRKGLKPSETIEKYELITV